MNKNEIENYLLSLLSDLRDETSRNYEINLHEINKELSRYIVRNKDLISDNEKMTNDIIYDVLRNIINNNINVDNNLSYNAFYLLSIITRRNKDFSVWKSLYDSLHLYFEEHESLMHILNVYYLSTTIPKHAYDSVLKYGKEYANKFPDNPGYLHCYSDIVATIYEDANLYDNKDYIDIILNDHLKKALDAIEKALKLESNYAKFYSTKGRLLAINGEIENGIKYIREAINLENSSSSSYLLKIIGYESQIQYIRLNQYQNKQKDTIEDFRSSLEVKSNEIKDIKENADKKVTDLMSKVEQKMDSNLIKNIEVLTFFTGLIGFLVSAISIGVNINDNNIFKYVIMIFSAFLVTFSFMDIIIRSKKVNKENVYSYIFNIIAIIVGLVLISITYFV
ncbi:MAG: tetratricopeptide repeat protein [Candidatus Izemoplasmatales bacterium]